jgi:hypothetical protein
MSGVSGLDVSGAEKQVEYTLSAASGGKLAMTYSLDGGITTVTANSRFDINTYNSSNPYSGFVGFEDEDGKDIGIKLHLIKIVIKTTKIQAISTVCGCNAGNADVIASVPAETLTATVRM